MGFYKRKVDNTAFWIGMVCYHHQHRVFVPGVGTAMLLWRGPHEPDELAQLWWMSSIHQPQPVADRQSNVDSHMSMSHRRCLRQQSCSAPSAVYIVSSFLRPLSFRKRYLYSLRRLTLRPWTIATQRRWIDTTIQNLIGNYTRTPTFSFYATTTGE